MATRRVSNETELSICLRRGYTVFIKRISGKEMKGGAIVQPDQVYTTFSASPELWGTSKPKRITPYT